MNLRGFLADALLCAVVTIVAAYCAWLVLHPLGNHLDSRFGYLYGFFEPAIQIAAGNGMVDLPPAGSIPELDDYREGRAPTFDPSLLSDFPTEAGDPPPFLSMHFYLMHSIGMTYWIFGVNRWSILLLCGFLHAASAALLYGIYRLGMGRALSLLGGVLSASSPVYLSMCSSLRDFGKAPWMLAVVLVLGILVRYRHKGKLVFAFSVLLGAIMGIGYGFRQDLLVCLLPALAVVLVIARVDGSKAIVWRLGASAAMVLLFGVLAQPVLRGMRSDGGSVSSHTLIQGLARDSERTMGFGGASYEFNLNPNDDNCHALVNSYARRTGNASPMELYHSPSYGRAGREMFLDALFLCPADQFSRGLAAVAATPNLLTSTWDEHPPYPDPESDPLDQFERLHAPVSNRLVRVAFLCVILGAALLGMYDLRIALGAFFLLAYFGAYPSLLYAYRHAFHLSFIPYWFTGLCLSFLGRGIRYAAAQSYRKRFPDKETRNHLARRLFQGLAFITAGLVLVLGVLGTLLPIQRANLGRTIAQLGDVRLEPLTVNRKQSDNGTLFAISPSIGESQGGTALPPGETASEYLLAVFRGSDGATPVRIEYDEPSFGSLSQDLVLPPTGGLRFFFPALESNWYGNYQRFEGLLVPEENKDNFEGLYRVANSHELRLWPFVMLPDRKDEFIWSKTGPLERALMGLSVELRSGFRYSRHKALEGYLELSRKYPRHLPFTQQAFILAAAGGQFEDVMRAWNTVLRNRPTPSAEAVASLVSLRDAGTFAPDKLRAMQKGFEELWGGETSPPLSQVCKSREVARILAEQRGAAAKLAFRDFIESSPSFYPAYEGLSGLYVEEKDLKGLEEEWRTAVWAHPGRMLAHFSLGLALERQDHLADATAAYEKALILKPSALGTKQALTRTLRAMAEVLAESGKAEDALRVESRARSMWAEGGSPSL